jgi:DNA-binding transcriptional ArsR family regulator
MRLLLAHTWSYERFRGNIVQIIQKGISIMSNHLSAPPVASDSEEGLASLGLLESLGLAIAYVAIAALTVNLLLLPVTTV